MDEMRELITVDQANRLFLAIAVAVPVFGLLFGTVLGARSGNARTGALRGLLVGLFGPINFVLWKVYNGITDRLGLDTVKNLLVNLGLFIGLGIAAGLAYGYLTRNKYDRLDGGSAGPGIALEPAGPSPARGPGTQRDFGESDRPARDP